jgi:hypothetical protein
MLALMVLVRPMDQVPLNGHAQPEIVYLHLLECQRVVAIAPVSNIPQPIYIHRPLVLASVRGADAIRPQVHGEQDVNPVSPIAVGPFWTAPIGARCHKPWVLRHLPHLLVHVAQPLLGSHSVHFFRSIRVVALLILPSPSQVSAMAMIWRIGGGVIAKHRRRCTALAYMRSKVLVLVIESLADHRVALPSSWCIDLQEPICTRENRPEANQGWCIDFSHHRSGKSIHHPLFNHNLLLGKTIQPILSYFRARQSHQPQQGRPLEVPLLRNCKAEL